MPSRQHDGPFRSAEDLAQRVPSLNRRDLTRLAQIGALNQLDGVEHRRDALWQVERAGKLEGPLLRQESESLREDSAARPLLMIDSEHSWLGTLFSFPEQNRAYKPPEAPFSPSTTGDS